MSRSSASGLAAAAVTFPSTAEALAAELARARAAGLKVLPAGQGTRLGAGGPPGRIDLVLRTTELARIVHYEPADLTVTVEAGCSLESLARTLAERGQFLPQQAWRMSGTIGGLVATAAEGCLALAHGGVRDGLCGLRAALADGTLVKGGGRVVKNVAGYPLHRLLAGSFGTLGVIVEASFKVQPRPEMQAAVLVAFATAKQAFEAARCVLAKGLEPVFVNVLIEQRSTRSAGATATSAGATAPYAGMTVQSAGTAAQSAGTTAEDAGTTAEDAGTTAEDADKAAEDADTAVALPPEIHVVSLTVQSSEREPPVSGGIRYSGAEQAIVLAVGFDGLASRVAAHVAALPDIVRAADPLDIKVLSEPAQAALRRRLDDPAAAVLPGIPFAWSLSDARGHSESGGVGVQAAGGVAGDGCSEDGVAGARAVGGMAEGTSVRMTALPSRIEILVQSALTAARLAGADFRMDVRPGVGSIYLSLGGDDPRAVLAATAATLAVGRTIGHATIVCAPRANDVDPAGVVVASAPWGPPPPDFFLMQRIKQALDPEELFTAGRFVGGI